MKGLIAVAHPDDETIFFAGLIQAWKHIEWTVVCATDGNWRGRGEERQNELIAACATLKIKHIKFLGFADNPNYRLKLKLLTQELSQLPAFDYVFTHGIFGEYSHPHHQDISYATHAVFSKKSKVFGIAYNEFPDLLVALSRKHYAVKSKILRSTYLKETVKILHHVPTSAVEGFTRNSIARISKIYHHICGKKKLSTQDLDFWLAEFTRRSTQLNKKSVNVSPKGL